MGDLTQAAGAMGREVRGTDWFDHAVRFGMVVYGVVHLVLAWLALQLALGDRSGSASSTGALRELAQQPLGAVVVWAVAVGMALLVLWRLLDAAFGHRGEDGGELRRHRLTDLFKAVLYGALAAAALRIATGRASGTGSSGSGSDTLTARVMSWPGGQLLVGAAGVTVLAYAGLLVWRGVSEQHAEHLATEGRTGEAGRAYLLLGKVGHVAKGIAIGVVGVLFVYAAVTHQARKSGGLDQALREVLQQPFGPWLLGAIAVGIGCYGLFCFARARHLSR
jgi:hypothetical protein